MADQYRIAIEAIDPRHGKYGVELAIEYPVLHDPFGLGNVVNKMAERIIEHEAGFDAVEGEVLPPDKEIEA